VGTPLNGRVPGTTWEGVDEGVELVVEDDVDQLALLVVVGFDVTGKITIDEEDGNGEDDRGDTSGGVSMIGFGQQGAPHGAGAGAATTTTRTSCCCPECPQPLLLSLQHQSFLRLLHEFCQSAKSTSQSYSGVEVVIGGQPLPSVVQHQAFFSELQPDCHNAKPAVQSKTKVVVAIVAMVVVVVRQPRPTFLQQYSILFSPHSNSQSYRSSSQS